MVAADVFASNVNIIYKMKPKYVADHDELTECDCIGMIRRALKMEGSPAYGLTGTNYAARYTILNLKKITSVSDLRIGDVVLQGRKYNPHDEYPLPIKYLQGGSLFNGDLINYVHIGTVTKINPLEITHMIKPAAKKDTMLGRWNYYGQLPQVKSEVVIVVEYATVIGGSLNIRAEKNTNSERVAQILSGSRVAVTEHGSEWCKIVYNAYTGYVMTKYLKFESSDDKLISITLTRETALALYEALKLSLNK